MSAPGPHPHGKVLPFGAGSGAGQATSLQCDIRDVEEPINICEANLRAACPSTATCKLHHFPLPYLWQVYLVGKGWRNLVQESESIERAYCNPGCAEHSTEIPARRMGGGTFQMQMRVNFSRNQVHLSSSDGLLPPAGIISDVRRLSTASYMQEHLDRGIALSRTEGEDVQLMHWTPWRWYWWSGSQWKLFHQDGVSPKQYVLEAKYLCGQEMYRFVLEVSAPDSVAGASSGATKKKQVFLLDFRHMSLNLLGGSEKYQISRRPLFVSAADISTSKFVMPPEITKIPFAENIPDSWTPVDSLQECELVPLNPDSMQFHLIASEFTRSMKIVHIIKDVFRIQNPYLWHKFHSKKLYMQGGRREVRELQLFHGTSSEATVQAIFLKNFDWRMYGKNNTLYGQGSYFAQDAAFSDRYTDRRGALRWQFMARVLVGRSRKGHTSYRVPPLLDPSDPLSERYDSCVDSEINPNIYVIFDCDQCYPEFLLSYEVKI